MHVRYLTDLAEVPDSDRGMALTWSEKARFGKRVFDAACRRCPGPIARWTGATRSMPTDYANWYRNDLRDLVRERLLDSGNAGDDVLNRTAVETIVTEHLEGIADHTAKIGCLLTFVSWRHAVRRSIQLTRSLTSGAKQA
jgi:hypothetical protein